MTVEVAEYMYIKVICNDGKLIIRRVIEPQLFIIIVQDYVISESLKLYRLFSSCVILNLIFHSNLAKKKHRRNVQLLINITSANFKVHKKFSLLEDFCNP